VLKNRRRSVGWSSNKKREKPLNGTDELNLEQLTSDVKTASDALPANLSDDWLDKIAQDLEALFDEESQEGEVEPNSSVSAALCSGQIHVKVTL